MSKIPLKEYTPKLECLYHNGASGKFINSTFGKSLFHIKNATNYSLDFIDINTIDNTKYDTEKNRWRLSKNPTVEPFIYQIQTGTHPYTYIDKKFEVRNGLYDYINSEIVKETKNPKYCINYSDRHTNYKFPDISYIPRFCKFLNNEPIEIDNLPENLIKICIALNYNIPLKNGIKSSEKIKVDKDMQDIFPLTLSEKQIMLHRALAASYNITNGYYLATKPHICEFDNPKEPGSDGTSIWDKVVDHFKYLPNFTITSLIKRKLHYYSDSDQRNCPLAYPRRYLPDWLPKFERLENASMLYAGEAWRLTFLIEGKDYLQGMKGTCAMYIVTPEQYAEAYKNHPKVRDHHQPWADLMFIASHWCETNGPQNNKSFHDLSVPHLRKLTPYTWVISSLFDHIIRSGFNLPNKDLITVYSGASTRHKFKNVLQAKARMQKIQEKIRELSTFPENSDIKQNSIPSEQILY